MMQSRNLLWWILLISLVTSACGRHRRVVQVPGAPASQSGASGNGTPGSTYTEVGYASWYGDPYHGRRAANGEIYDKNKLTAAHRTLPFGTQVKVTDLSNHRSVSVRITDRGPFVNGRIIDLSLAGARAIQLVGPGVSLVRLEAKNISADTETGQFAVQVGAFRERAAAERLLNRVRGRYGDAYIKRFRSPDGPVHRVSVGTRPTLAQAGELAGRLRRDKLPTFIVRLDATAESFVTAKK